MKFTIDTSRIPESKLNDSHLPEIEAGLRRALEDSQTRMYACLHEAGHAIFMERAGVAFSFRGPSIWYDAKHDILKPALAGVLPGVPGEDWIANSLQMARWSVAGIITAETLLPSSNPPDDKATTDFETFCAEMRKEGATEESILKHWEQAKLDVAEDLESTGFKRRIWTLARVFNQQLETEFGMPETEDAAA